MLSLIPRSSNTNALRGQVGLASHQAKESALDDFGMRLNNQLSSKLEL